VLFVLHYLGKSEVFTIPFQAVVRDGKAQLVSVKINHDYGNSVEIVSGLQPTDAVIVDPSDSLVDATPVRVSNNLAGGSAP
jgi:multidrug efflux pump subunit AcrA (membrane-fusion protein)